jgi:TPR repeat protein
MKRLWSVVCVLLILSSARADERDLLIDAARLGKAGQYQEALDKYLAFYGGATDRSFAVFGLIKLAKQYPPAMTALLKIRDERTAELRLGRDLPDEDVSSVFLIDRMLPDHNHAAELFEFIGRKKTEQAKACWRLEILGPALIATEKFDLAAQYIDRPDLELGEIVLEYRQRLNDPAIGRLHLEKTVEENFTRKADMLIDICEGVRSPVKNLYLMNRLAKGIQDMESGHNTDLSGVQKFLAQCYYDGVGVKQDYAKAVNWCRKAAEQGDSDAQYSLGYCYENGEGVKPDAGEAAGWYRKAAEQNNSDGQYALGECYYNGVGVKQDYAEAVNWYRKAAEQKHAYAQYNLGYCYENGEGVTRNVAEAVSWYRKAAEQDTPDGQYALGECYYKGLGVKQDYVEAVNWYRKAAEQGMADAQYRLGEVYEKGSGVEKSHEEAMNWYRKAAEQGHVEAEQKCKKP